MGREETRYRGYRRALKIKCITDAIKSGTDRALLEQTVANIEEYSYTLQSSEQGEYDVIAVSDRYCRVGSAESVTKRKSLKA